MKKLCATFLVFLVVVLLTAQSTNAQKQIQIPTPTPKLLPTATPTPVMSPTPTPSPTPSPTPTPIPSPTPTSGPIELGAWYAANGPGTFEESAADHLQTEGFTVVRTRVIWTAATGQWAWSDAEIDYHVAAGRKVLLEFWAHLNGPHPTGGDCSTGSLADYTTLVQGIASRYGDDLFAIQPDNEVDMCNNPVESADRLAIVYDIFDATAPDVIVVAPGLAYDHFVYYDAPPGYYPMGSYFKYSTLGTMLGRLSSKSCAPCTDAFAFHKYQGFNYWPTVIAKAADIRNRLASYGWENMDLWLTEFGAPYNPNPYTEMTQATQLLMMAESARDEGGIPVAIVYSALDQGSQFFGLFYSVPPRGVNPHIAVPTLGAMPR